MKQFFKAQPYNEADKLITIDGPGDLLLYVDYDDVEHDAVDARLPLILDALNYWWNIYV